MRRLRTVEGYERFGRMRLSRHFIMRDMLMSEISVMHGIPNVPDDPTLAVAAGQGLAQTLLEPLVETFGPITIRSSLRNCDVNRFGNENGHNCAANEKNFAGHIWDRRDQNGHMGATACLVIPWFADQYDKGRDWRDLAWWLHDHLEYSAIWFHPVRAAFNLTWHQQPQRTISSYITPKGKLLVAGATPDEPQEQRQTRYADFPTFRGITYPPLP